MSSFQPTRPRHSTVFWRGGRRRKPRRFAPRGGERSPSLAVAFPQTTRGVTEPTLALRSPCADAPLVAHRLTSRQASARFRPRTMTDSPLSARSIHCRTPLHRLRGMLSLIPTAANCRDSQKNVVRARRFRRPRDSVRPTPAIARETSSGQDISNRPRGSARPSHRH